MSTQATYDVEFVEGEFGDTYTFRIKNDDGTDADITGYDAVRLVIETLEGVEKLNITTNLTLSSPNVLWAMQSGQTDYQGEHVAQIILTDSTPARNKKVKVFTVFVHRKLA